MFVLGSDRRIDRRQGVPVSIDIYIAFSVYYQSVAGGQLSNVLKQGLRCRRGQKRKVIRQCGLIDIAHDIRMSEDCLYLGREDDPAIFDIKIQGFYTQSIPIEREFFPLFVPQANSEIAVDLVHKIPSPLLVEVNDRLGIGL